MDIKFHDGNSFLILVIKDLIRRHRRGWGGMGLAIVYSPDLLFPDRVDPAIDQRAVGRGCGGTRLTYVQFNRLSSLIQHRNPQSRGPSVGYAPQKGHASQHATSISIIMDILLLDRETAS